MTFTPSTPSTIGHYQLLEEIGRTNVTTSYRAVDTTNGAVVALEVLSAPYQHNRTLVARILQEAGQAARLQHPNLIRVLDYGQVDDQTYLATEYVPGTPLRQLILTSTPLLPERAAQLADQMSRAVESAHNLGLAHGELNPENVVLDAAGRVRVGELGLGRALVETLDPSDPALAPARPYLAPEMVRGQVPDARSDVYSIGVILQEMLTGLLPGQEEVVFQRGAARPAGQEVVVHHIPPQLDAIVRRALSPRPDDRYQSGGELAAAVEGYLGTPPQQPETVVRVMTPPARPSRGLESALALVGALALLALIVLFFVFYTNQRASSTATVPNLVRLPVAQAVQLAEAYGYRVGVARFIESTEPADTVIGQSPEAGRPLAKGETIRVDVAKPLPAADQVTVPSIIGQPLSGAQQTLQQAGLSIGQPTSRPDPAVPAGLIVDQNPHAGLVVARGSAVNVVLSAGPGTAAPIVVTSAPPAVVTVPVIVATAPPQPPVFIIPTSPPAVVVTVPVPQPPVVITVPVPIVAPTATPIPAVPPPIVFPTFPPLPATATPTRGPYPLP